MCLGYRRDTEADRVTSDPSVIGDSSNGRTEDFESSNGGSSPSSPTKYKDCELCRTGVAHDKVNDEVVTPENLDAKLKAAFEKSFEISFDFIDRWKNE